MKKISVFSSNKLIHEIFVNKYKYFYGTKNELNSLYVLFYNYFIKIGDSEFAKESNCSTYIQIDESSIDFKTTFLLNYSSNFQIDEDNKIVTKTLYYKLMETALKNIDKNEVCQTINILLSDLLNDIEEQINDDLESTKILINNFEINGKNLIKNLLISFIKDECKTNSLDYEFDNLVKIQTELFKYIIKNNPQELFIIISQFPISLSEYIQFKNVIILIFDMTTNTSLENTYLINKHADGADDEQMYNIFFNESRYGTFEEFKLNYLSTLIKSS